MYIARCNSKFQCNSVVKVSTGSYTDTCCFLQRKEHKYVLHDNQQNYYINHVSISSTLHAHRNSCIYIIEL